MSWYFPFTKKRWSREWTMSVIVDIIPPLKSIDPSWDVEPLYMCIMREGEENAKRFTQGITLCSPDNSCSFLCIRCHSGMICLDNAFFVAQGVGNTPARSIDQTLRWSSSFCWLRIPLHSERCRIDVLQDMLFRRQQTQVYKSNGLCLQILYKLRFCGNQLDNKDLHCLSTSLLLILCTHKCVSPEQYCYISCSLDMGNLLQVWSKADKDSFQCTLHQQLDIQIYRYIGDKAPSWMLDTSVFLSKVEVLYCMPLWWFFLVRMKIQGMQIVQEWTLLWATLTKS